MPYADAGLPDGLSSDLPPSGRAVCGCRPACRPPPDARAARDSLGIRFDSAPCPLREPAPESEPGARLFPGQRPRQALPFLPPGRTRIPPDRKQLLAVPARDALGWPPGPGLLPRPLVGPLACDRTRILTPGLSVRPDFSPSVRTSGTCGDTGFQEPDVGCQGSWLGMLSRAGRGPVGSSLDVGPGQGAEFPEPDGGGQGSRLWMRFPPLCGAPPPRTSSLPRMTDPDPGDGSDPPDPNAAARKVSVH
jgi:hypothetical protein